MKKLYQYILRFFGVLLLILSLASCNIKLTSSNSNKTDTTDNTNTGSGDSKNNGEEDGNNTDKGTSTLTVYSFNDVHGYIMQNSAGQRGISNLAYSINKVREEVGKENVMLLANGDMFQGTGLVRMSYGKVMIDIMNEMDFDACCLGNHEFDWDLPVILNYFDGDTSNGEANFPLLNANVYSTISNTLITGKNIYSSYMYEKAGVKVGVIGFIGDVKSSINALYTSNYDFKTDFSSMVTTIGGALKDDGADIILVSIHDGNTNGVDAYQANQTLAKLKYNGSYLVDGVFNGHTHTHQSGKITRTGGVAMPVIQSNGYSDGYLNEVGRVDFTIDLNTKTVTDTKTSWLSASTSGKNYDEKVENILQSYYQKDKDLLEEVFCKNNAYISRYAQTTYDFVSNTVLAACGTDAFISNTGGLRCNLSAGNLTFEDIYQFIPFDNEIIIHKTTKAKLDNFINNNSGYYYYKYKENASGEIYVAVIDYVYYSKYYSALRSDDAIVTHLQLRDLLIQELRLHTNGLNLSSSQDAYISRILNKNYIYEE